jgi:hypothetical protein
MRGGCVVLLVLALLRLIAFQQEPTGSISGDYTDHISHIGETRAVFRVGLDLWRKAPASMFRKLTPEERMALPADIRAFAELSPNDVMMVPGFLPSAPLVINYSHLPRCYPPGVFLVSAPSALLYHFGLVSFAVANRIYLALLALLWLGTMFLVTSVWRDESPTPARILLTLLGAVYMLYWAQEGLYDTAAVASAVLGIHLQRQRRFGFAALSWGLAVLVHSRLLGLLPLCALSMVQGLQAWKSAKWSERIALVCGLSLFVTALGFAGVIQSIVRLHASNASWLRNILRPEPGNFVIQALYAALLLGLLIWLLRVKSYLDASTVLVVGVAFAVQRYLGPWYWLLVVPWAISGTASGRRMLRAEAIARASLAVSFVVACLFCHR